jgi:D-psicose/D-tagatose/L-ribulose 3-epimerase
VHIGFNLLVVGGTITPADRPVLESLKRHGYDGVEVPVMSGAEADYAALGRLLDELGLARTTTAIIPDSDHSPMSGDPAIRRRARDRLAWAIDCGHALGATVMGGPYHSPLGVFSGAGPTEDELANLAEALHWAAGRAQDAGIHLSIEAVNRFECYALNTMEQCSRLRARVGHPNFGFMYDTFHANIEERDPVGVISAHAAGITHVHLSENDRGIPGRGHVPFPATLRALRGIGYDGWLTVEAFGRALPDLAAATRVWRDLFPDLDTLFAESIALIRREWEAAA